MDRWMVMDRWMMGYGMDGLAMDMDLIDLNWGCRGVGGILKRGWGKRLKIGGLVSEWWEILGGCEMWNMGQYRHYG